ncbi:MAG: PQQ-like beta-propeller repeat protein [Verrucomicrobia bacterium]|nr:PQQ-like beta-propeller repeat protein [Verrucomicrobiota bacterium]
MTAKPRKTLGLMLVLFLFSVAVRGQAPYWPGWRGSLRDGKSPDTNLLKQWPAEGPERLWKADGIGNGFSNVAVAGGMIYTTGDIDDRLILFAFDLDGKQKWKIDVDAAWIRSHSGSRSTPMIDGGKLYLISGNGLVGCYDAKTGTRIWDRTMREFGGKTPGWGYAESVLIYQNLAIVTPGGEKCIVALDKTTGETVWTSQGFKAGAQYSSCHVFTYQGMPMIVNGTQQGIVCVDPKDGRVLWSNPFSARNTANCPTPVFSDGYVFWANGYGKGGICFKLTVTGGQVGAEEVWWTKDMNCHHGGYIVHNGYIYGNNGGGWTCLDLKSGRKMWKERGVRKGSVCFADGMLYLFGERGGTAGLATCSPDGMEMRGSFDVQGSGSSWAHPVVIGGRLYLRYDTNLYCYDVRIQGR